MLLRPSLHSPYPHRVCVNNLDEPAVVHGRLKLTLPRSVTLHVEDKGHGALVALEDLLQPVLFECLQERAQANKWSP